MARVKIEPKWLECPGGAAVTQLQQQQLASFVNLIVVPEIGVTIPVMARRAIG